eukprot:m.518525 g.518525  ORF g.518525 m.518525 type:complete len:61 (+) comp21940_c0_seq9:2944-3126(+)
MIIGLFGQLFAVAHMCMFSVINILIKRARGAAFAHDHRQTSRLFSDDNDKTAVVDLRYTH